MVLKNYTWTIDISSLCLNTLSDADAASVQFWSFDIVQ